MTDEQAKERYERQRRHLSDRVEVAEGALIAAKTALAEYERGKDDFIAYYKVLP